MPAVSKLLDLEKNGWRRKQTKKKKKEVFLKWLGGYVDASIVVGADVEGASLHFYSDAEEDRDREMGSRQEKV
jgi:hypothetical protein